MVEIFWQLNTELKMSGKQLCVREAECSVSGTRVLNGCSMHDKDAPVMISWEKALSLLKN